MMQTKICLPIRLTLLCLILSLPALQGCIPIIIAAAAGGGYLAADEDAQKNVNAWLADVGEKINHSKIGNAKAAEKSLGYKKGGSVNMEFNSFTITPSRVAPGKTITLKVEYAIAGANKTGLWVTDKKELWKGSTKIINLDSQSSKRPNGIWESRTSFQVPKGTEPGKYKIKQSIAGANLKLQTASFFTVTP